MMKPEERKRLIEELRNKLFNIKTQVEDQKADENTVKLIDECGTIIETLDKKD